jgi:hypothetical protein
LEFLIVFGEISALEHLFGVGFVYGATHAAIQKRWFHVQFGCDINTECYIPRSLC